jgi:hypothetical protein
VTLCDGSVQFIDNSIQVNSADASTCVAPPYLSVWDLLNLSQDAQTIPNGAF